MLIRGGEPSGAPREPNATSRRPIDDGFTLIELLVVIAIIGTLVGLVAATVTIAQRKAHEGEAKTDMNEIGRALESYKTLCNQYPGVKNHYDGDDYDKDALRAFNQMPEVIKELYYGKKTNKRARLRDPLLSELKPKNFAVLLDEYEDAYNEEDPVAMWREATAEEVADRDVKKYYLDPFSTSYIYRECYSFAKKHEWMFSEKFDLWSAGPNRLNEAYMGPTSKNEDEEWDDIFR